MRQLIIHSRMEIIVDIVLYRVSNAKKNYLPLIVTKSVKIN